MILNAIIYEIRVKKNLPSNSFGTDTGNTYIQKEIPDKYGLGKTISFYFNFSLI